MTSGRHPSPNRHAASRALAPRHAGQTRNPDAKARYARRKQTVDAVFGIIKSAFGFTRFHLRGLAKVTSEWALIALAYNCRRLHNLRLVA